MKSYHVVFNYLVKNETRWGTTTIGIDKISTSDHIEMIQNLIQESLENLSIHATIVMITNWIELEDEHVEL